MALLHCGMALLAASSALVSNHVPTRQLVRSHPAPAYTAGQMEAYLTAQQVEYIRPGYNITLVGIQIPADRKPLVEVKFTDDMNQPLDRLGQVTPGACSASMILGWYDAPHRDYVSYTTRVQTSPITNVSATQASADSGGTWTTIALGHYTYKFRTALPASFDQSKTTTLGIYGSRNLQTIIEKTYYDNVLYDFRPDGAAVTETWDAFATATCNNCHDPLALHGGSRREVKLCVLCHNRTQSLDPDTGNTVEMRLMVHKIHNGPNLANGYTIIGFGQAVHDYSHVTYPQDVRNCTTCHKDNAAEGYIYYTNPQRTACGACHDDVDFAAGTGHIPQADDSACASCHPPQGEFEFDTSIKGAHTIPTKSARLKGLNMEILAVTGATPGGKVKVDFRITEDDGTFVNPTTLASCNLLIGGSTVDFAKYLRQSCRTATTVGDVSTQEFATALPDDASGTWAMSADYYRNVTLNPGPAAAFREAGYNPYYAFVVSGAKVARRAVVDEAKCNKCHDVLALHGGQRYRIDECLICHNPNESDVSRRPADQAPPESVHMKYMIHKIHTGEENTNDLTIYGFGGTPHNYNEVLYPGDRRNCEACHKGGTYGVPLPEGTLPTITQRDWYTPMQPAAAACISCHTSIDAAAHAYVNTAPFAEACAACHGTGHEFAVTKVHAR